MTGTLRAALNCSCVSATDHDAHWNKCNIRLMSNTYIGTVKTGRKQNVIPTNREQNMAAAKVCDTFKEACLLFKSLQWANNMSATMTDSDELKAHFNRGEFRSSGQVIEDMGWKIQEPKKGISYWEKT